MKGVLRRIVESKTLSDFTKVNITRGYRARFIVETEEERLNLLSQLRNLDRTREIFLPYMEELELQNFKELEDE